VRIRDQMSEPPEQESVADSNTSVVCGTAHRSHRLYNCALCRQQVSICTRCDRGNRYCSPRCASVARRDSLRKAGQRYQRTPMGQLHHRARQQAYRRRSRVEQPTAQRPEPASPGVPQAAALLERANHMEQGRCYLCGRPCSPFARRDSIRSSRSSWKRRRPGRTPRRTGHR